MAKRTRFKKEGYKKVFCPDCGYYLDITLFLNSPEKSPEKVKCRRCGAESMVHHPKKGLMDGREVIVYGIGGATITGDLTDSEIENTLKP